jgi:hypothetical protein
MGRPRRTEMKKNETWEDFVSWWQSLKETAAESSEPQYKVTYPENTIGDCETYKDELEWQKIATPPMQSEYGKTQRMLSLHEAKACHMTKIHAIQDFGIRKPEPDLRMYCEKCWDELMHDYWRMKIEEGPSHAEQAEADMRNFGKFFRNWYFGLYDAEEVSRVNDTGWKFHELMEIFSILKMFVMTNDDVAAKLDAQMSAWKTIAQQIISVVNEDDEL